MEADLENASEHYSDKFVQINPVGNEVASTAYSENDKVNSYTEYVSHEQPTEVLTNNEIDSQEFIVETTSLTFSESCPSTVNILNNDSDTKEDNESQLQEPTFVTENTQVDACESIDNSVQIPDIEYTTEYKVEEIQTENDYIPTELPEESSNIVIEEPVENSDQSSEQHVTEEIITIEEVDNATLHKEECSKVLITEVEDSDNAKDEATLNEDTFLRENCEYQATTSQKSEHIEENIMENNLEHYVDSLEDNKLKNLEFLNENIEDHNMDESTETTEGDLIIEEPPPDQVEDNSEEPQEEVIYEEACLKENPAESQSIEEVQPLIQQNENAQPEISETVTFETIADDGQITGEYTIIETPESIQITTTTNVVEELAGDQTLTEHLNLPVSESFSQDDSLNQDSSQELIIIQDTSIEPTEDNPDDPQPQESQSVDQPVPQDAPQTPITKPKSRKGRKATFDIPMHVLGHDINKPLEPVVNGRALPKPRLGVKVPYRNLTSQIVSKAEIEKEIMERGRLKMEQSKGDLKFARSLTQRLAKKIAPAVDISKQDASDDAEEKTKILEVDQQSTSATEQTSIQNDSDLLAILEGDGDESDMPVVKKETASSPQVDESNLKALEREIALQQLSELPNQTPKQRIFRGKVSKLPSTSTGNFSKEKSINVVASNSQNISRERNKENSTVSSSPTSKKDHMNVSPRKQAVEIEPQVKVNMVLKTYSRKRKISEPQDPLKDYPPPKKPIYPNNDDLDMKMDISESTQISSPVYITKSSRVIKKKVIWDPDEVPVRSPKPSPKPTTDIKSTFSKTPPLVKIVKTDKNSNAEKVVEKRTPDKRIEKPQIEKKFEKSIVDKKMEKTPTRKSVSPKANSNSKPKKIRSEIDKLLMDEGAVKMLYELNNTDETAPKKKKDFYSVDRAQKEIIKKANLLKNELEQTTTNDSQISLRKKEGIVVSSVTPSPTRSGPILERKMSKDSTRSSVHTPPGSPFPHSQSSMLIRRRSSSSLSSSDDMEIEFKPREMRRKTDTPKLKKPKKSEDEKSELDESGSGSSKTGQTPKRTVKATILEVKLNQFKAFTVKKTGKHVNVDLNYIDEKCYFTARVLEELTSVLRKFSNDKDCNMLTLTSSSKSFCLGLDYFSLVKDDEEKRKDLATELSEKVKDFLICLLHFPKVLIACIQGDCMGLGVTMLPLFDLVIASDSATFATPYSSLGCIGEAAFLLGYPNLVSQGLASELLYTGQKLTADEAFRRGLISKLCWPEKYKETMKTMVGSITKASKQSLEATKKQLRIHKSKDIEAAISSERKIWIEHWISSECQERFSQLGSAF